MSMIDIWRKKARDLRERAAREPDEAIHRQLLALADDYDDLVTDLERLPAPADQ